MREYWQEQKNEVWGLQSSTQAVSAPSGPSPTASGEGTRGEGAAEQRNILRPWRETESGEIPLRRPASTWAVYRGLTSEGWLGQGPFLVGTLLYSYS